MVEFSQSCEKLVQKRPLWRLDGSSHGSWHGLGRWRVVRDRLGSFPMVFVDVAFGGSHGRLLLFQARKGESRRGRGWVAGLLGESGFFF